MRQTDDLTQVWPSAHSLCLSKLRSARFTDKNDDNKVLENVDSAVCLVHENSVSIYIFLWIRMTVFVIVIGLAGTVIKCNTISRYGDSKAHIQYLLTGAY